MPAPDQPRGSPHSALVSDDDSLHRRRQRALDRVEIILVTAPGKYPIVRPIESLALGNAMITFFDGLASQSVDLMDFFDDTSLIYDPSLELGNNTANRFAPITAASLGLEQFDRIEFNLGGSDALDSLGGIAVPEPSTRSAVLATKVTWKSQPNISML